MSNIHLQETRVNKDRGYIYDESPIYESFTDHPGDLFGYLQQEFGRCVSSLYIDRKDGSTIKIGWVFEKKVKYDDSKEKFTQEVWVTLYAKDAETKDPKKIYNYLELKGK